MKEKLAACIQLYPIMSLYRWKGRIENANEYLCIIKTKKSKFKDLVNKIKENHSYQIPEIIAFEIENGNKDYIKWLEEES